MLKGVIIDHYTGQRRPKVRFFACAEDVSLQTLDTELSPRVATGEEPLIIIGAISGGLRRSRALPPPVIHCPNTTVLAFWIAGLCIIP